ncbi:MAG: PKD domain-containing protein [Amnibacterium sp.]
MVTALLTTLATLAAIVLVAPPAMAATSYGHVGPSYSGVANPPTSDKPQSKLWYNDGSWWATMWTSGKGWDIWRLDRGTESWVDTRVTTDTRSTALTHTLWDGSHLFVAAQYATVSTGTAPVAGKTGNPAKLYRYSYTNGTYTLDSGFPVNINNISSETLTIDEDTLGQIWSSWVQISGSSSAGYTATVYVNHSGPGGTGWGTPYVLPGAAHPSVDDISAVVAFKGKIGVMWSDEASSHVYFALHTDGAADSSWNILTARSGTNTADDHMNLKTLQSDSTGRVYAVLKTSLDLTYGLSSTQPGIVMVTYTPGASTPFQSSTVSRIVDCETRPQLILDTQNNQVHVVVTGPDAGTTGCPSSGTPGAIYEKTASMGATQSWTTGRGTPIIEDGSSLNVNNPTTTKQSVNSASGFVVLASNDTNHRYWFSDEVLGSTTKPVASFTVANSTGPAPLTASFTDTSTNAPTQWSWDFGDGTTSTLQSPTHTYTAAGQYTVTLTASNAAGASTSTQTNAVTVGSGTGGGGGGAVTAGSSTTGTASTATTSVTLTKPTAVVDGDVLVANINADANPTITAPAGWTAVTSPLTDSTYARIFSYSKVVSSAAAEPSSYTFTLSAAEKWNGGITDFHGVDTTAVWDTAAATKVSTSSVSSIAVPSVTTVTPGAMLVGGDGVNSTSAKLAPPSGWTEAWEGDGGQDVDLGYKPMPAAGASGTSTFTHSASVSGAAWVRALKPATSGGSTGTAPTASFTEDRTSGTAPLTVQFTDTSTGSPTSWAWDFGDGTTSTAQSPQHVFAAGTYTVTLVASNGTGASTNTASASITATAPTGSAPTASFTEDTTSGTAPLTVQFTDTSTNSPTSWSWDFGDGTGSSAQNPSHIYGTQGTYTVKLVATNGTGSSTNNATATITVSPGSGGGGSGTVTAGASSTATGSSASTAVTIPAPSGVGTGDVLVASINANGTPSIANAPAGWTAVTSPVADSTYTTVFGYYHVVTGSEPGSYTFTLSASQKWNAGITDFKGVDTTAVWDAAAVTQVSTSGSTPQTLPSVTTVTDGAMLIGSNGVNSASITITPPSGWTEAWEANGGKSVDLAYKAMPTAGASGTSTFTHSSSISGSAWARPLRPAAGGGGGSTGSVPTASFTENTTSGTAPLAVQFTDTSTGSPTSWSWDFGDGSAKGTTQNPSHTYTAAGTYTVKLVATNSTGPSTNNATATITVSTAGGGGGGSITVGASSTAKGTTATTAVTVPAPTGVGTGDVLVASINANQAPTMASVPTGWLAVTAPVADGTYTTVFSYYHLVTGSEPGSYTFTLSASQKWSAGITDFKGVDTTTVWDSQAATQVSTSGSTPQTVPSVTTVTDGALLIGGNGVNSATITITPPSGWTEAWESDGGKDVDLAYKVIPTAGATGTSTFTHSSSISGSAWVRALKPA